MGLDKFKFGFVHCFELINVNEFNLWITFGEFKIFLKTKNFPKLNTGIASLIAILKDVEANQKTLHRTFFNLNGDNDLEKDSYCHNLDKYPG